MSIPSSQSMYIHMLTKLQGVSPLPGGKVSEVEVAWPLLDILARARYGR